MAVRVTRHMDTSSYLKMFNVEAMLPLGCATAKGLAYYEMELIITREWESSNIASLFAATSFLGKAANEFDGSTEPTLF